MTQEQLKAILLQLRQEFSRILGDRLEAMYLYGSQARGDARPDSDIDVLAVIRGTALTNDGSDKVGFTAPSVSGQATRRSAASGDQA